MTTTTTTVAIADCPLSTTTHMTTMEVAPRILNVFNVNTR